MNEEAGVDGWSPKHQSVTRVLQNEMGNVNNTEYMSVRSYFLFHSVRQLGLTPQLEHVQKSTCFLQTASIVQHY